jgi:hypothetical protein
MLWWTLIVACAFATFAAAQQYHRDSELYLVHFTGDRVDPDTCLLWDPASRAFRRPLSVAQADGSFIALAPNTALSAVPRTCSLYTELGIDSTTLIPPAYRPPALTDAIVAVGPAIVVAGPAGPVPVTTLGPVVTVPAAVPGPVFAPVAAPGLVPVLAPTSGPAFAPAPGVAPVPVVPGAVPVGPLVTAASPAAPAVRVPAPGSL